MLKFIKVRGENIPLEAVTDFTDEQLTDAYFDLKSEQVNVSVRLADLRIDKEYDRVREAGLLSASKHIALGIEYVQGIRRARRVRVSDRFMTEARRVLDAETFERIYAVARV